MPLLSATDLGHGPGIVLLHGVGVGADTFLELARLLAADHRVLVLERPGGDGWAVPIDEQAEAVAETMVELRCTGAVVVGVSGGATVALALGIHHAKVIGGLVLHEPLVGPLAPELHDRFTEAARHAQQGDAEALDVVRSLLGVSTWERLGLSGRVQVEAGASRARAEVPMFAAFSPTAVELATLRRWPVLTTIGGHSGPERRAAAEVLATLAGASVAVVPDAGNAAQLDAPAALAGIIRAWHPAPVGCGS
ncbi:MAG: alpha/beta fold hydrolase [Acidimicrobiales bacterium]